MKQKDLIDIGVASVLGGVAIGIANQSPLPGAVKQGVGGVVGIGLLSKTSKLLK